MHNLFLGQLRHHCMNVWGIPGVTEETDPSRNATPHTPVKQQEQFDRILRALQDSNVTMLVRIRRDYLAATAELNGLIQRKSKATKNEIAQALIAWASTLNTITRATVPLPVPLEESTTLYMLPQDGSDEEEVPTHMIFNHAVLQEVRRDIRNATVPTWIEKPPSNFGEAKHGKLKADHWRTVCTIFMVITLVRLWGHAGASQQERDVLNNFVQLVVAVDLATRRTMSPGRVATFDQNMEAYVKGLRSIYEEPLVPNHHLSLHLKDFLLAFGPVRGWWGYPFERINGMIQRFKTNHKPAEMPQTYMKYFYMAASLRWAMSTVEWPNVKWFHEWLETFKTVFRDITAGSRFVEWFSSFTEGAEYTYNERRHTILPESLYNQLFNIISTTSPRRFASAHASTNPYKLSRLPEEAHFVRSVARGAMKFTTVNSGKRDCYVKCRLSQGETTRFLVGRIEQIFYHRRSVKKRTIVEPFLVVSEYEPLSGEDQAHDPFRSFPELEAGLYYTSLRPVQVVPLSDVVSHVAVLPYTPEIVSKECIVIKSLDRVRLLLDPLQCW
ncbi:hypothetical protein OH76DRAFT_1361390 [Lentinus brumalis]|uniref:DUF4218 domain-containing protein n=1 Tax=Lentinus brumalis TaxID=2498619 RepID=A0A371CSN8_9APHY|nr:hypothetical protein OH76DRAFT_1361390 [Polyporus brumalis]